MARRSSRNPGELSSDIERVLGRRLLGLYLFGSLAAGDFVDGKSDLDLWAVVDAASCPMRTSMSCAPCTKRFETARPDWRDRVEVAYVSRGVLATFAATPTGTIARISPGEPLHLRESRTVTLAGGSTGTLSSPAERRSLARRRRRSDPRSATSMFRDAVVASYASSGTARENDRGLRAGTAGLHRGDRLPRPLLTRNRPADLEGDRVEWSAERIPGVRVRRSAYRAIAPIFAVPTSADQLRRQRRGRGRPTRVGLEFSANFALVTLATRPGPRRQSQA